MASARRRPGSGPLAAAGAAMFGPDGAERNPFTLPSDAEVFEMREAERAVRAERRRQLKDMPVWEKQPAARAGLIRSVRAEAEPEIDEELKDKIARTANLVSAATAAMTSAKRPEAESISAFIEKKREMFLLQMSLDTKREEIRKLEHKARMKEEALKKSELLLEEDAIRFDAFLKENDRLAHAAMKRAEEESRLKAAKLQEIKKLKYEIQALKGENAKHEDTLREWQSYKVFLDELTPTDWRESMLAELAAERAAAAHDAWKAEHDQWRAEADLKRAAILEEHGAAREKALRVGRRPPQLDVDAAVRAAMTHWPEPQQEEYPAEPVHEQDLPLYFTHPQQLLDIFAEMEEENLFLIQNNQEIEQQLEELKTEYSATQDSMERQTKSLEETLASLQMAIAAEEATAASLASGIGGSGRNSESAALIEQLANRIKAVYVQCGGDLTSNPDVIAMLTKLEGKLESSLAQLASMPEEYVAKKEREMEEARRERVRKQRAEWEEQEKAERVRRSEERSRAPVKKRTGRPVMARSAPLRKQQAEAKVDADALRAIVETRYLE